MHDHARGGGGETGGSEFSCFPYLVLPVPAPSLDKTRQDFIYTTHGKTIIKRQYYLFKV